MNSSFYFSEKYMQCAEEHMPQIKPFGDDHEKLALILQRSMVAARTTIKAVKSAHEIATEMKMVSISNFVIFSPSDSRYLKEYCSSVIFSSDISFHENLHAKTF